MKLILMKCDSFIQILMKLFLTSTDPHSDLHTGPSHWTLTLDPHSAPSHWSLNLDWTLTLDLHAGLHAGLSP